MLFDRDINSIQTAAIIVEMIMMMLKKTVLMKKMMMTMKMMMTVMMIIHCSVKDLEVWFDKDIHPMVGEAVVLTSHVKNISKDDRKVKAVFTVSTSPYWNRSRLDKQVAKEKLQDRLIKAGCGQYHGQREQNIGPRGRRVV